MTSSVTGRTNPLSNARPSNEDRGLDLFMPEQLQASGSREIFDDTLGDEEFQATTCEASKIAEPRRHPDDPMIEEVNQHNLTHCPYRSWCPICVEAQGGEDPHYRSIKEVCPRHPWITRS